MPKARRTIPEIDVDRVFDAECIRELAKESKFPKDTDLDKLGNEIRQNAHIYVKAASEPTANELHDEIKALHDASDKNQFERTGFLIDNLSARARFSLIGRWEHANPSIKFPLGIDLNNIDFREVVCAKIASLCRIGVKVAEGRNRPSGRHSKTWQVTYYAPEKVRHFPRTVAEDQFVAHLALTWCEITGELPPKVVHQDQGMLGPFGRFVQKCLRLSGSSANAANLINKYGHLRQRADLKLSD
jgi:hypothetical protein